MCIARGPGVRGRSVHPGRESRVGKGEGEPWRGGPGRGGRGRDRRQDATPEARGYQPPIFFCPKDFCTPPTPLFRTSGHLGAEALTLRCGSSLPPGLGPGPILFSCSRMENRQRASNLAFSDWAWTRPTMPGSLPKAHRKPRPGVPICWISPSPPLLAPLLRRRSTPGSTDTPAPPVGLPCTSVKIV